MQSPRHNRSTSRPAPGRTLRLALTLSLFVIAVLLLSSAPALATGTPFTGSFGGPCTGSAGACEPGQLSEPSGLAVNETNGDVYVVDKGQNRVEYFSSTGTYIGEFNGHETPAGSFDSISAIAVDNSCVGGALECPDPSVTDVYVLDAGHNLLDKFESDGKYIGQITGPPGQATFDSPTAVAVDSKGDVWVAQLDQQTGAGTIDEFNSQGAYLDQITSTPAGLFRGLRGIALDSADHLYAITANGNLEIEEEAGTFPNPLPLQVLQPECDCDTALAFADFAKDLYVDETTGVTEYTSTGQLVEQYGAGELTSGAGVALNTTTGAGYVADSASHDVHIFSIPASPPRVTVESCGGGGGGQPVPAGAGVEFCAEANPHGTTITDCILEWTTEPGIYDHTDSCSGVPPSGGSTPTEINAKLQGLEPGVTVYARFAVTNEVATTYGPVLEFKSPGPLIGTASAPELTPTSATLQLTINPDGDPTSYYFQYGTSSTYASEAPAAPGTPIGSGESGVLASQAIQGLSPNTVYHYRVAVVSELSPGHQLIFDGPDETLTTPPESQAEKEAWFKKFAEENAKKVAEQAAATEAAKKHEEEATAATAAKKHEEEELAATAAAKKHQEETAANSNHTAKSDTKTLTLTISKVKVGSSALTLTLNLSRAGILTISGSGLKTTTKTLGAGIRHIHLPLTKTGKSDRSHHNKIRLTIEIKSHGKTAHLSDTIEL